MAVRTDFVAGEVLAAQDLDDTFAAKVDYALPVDPEAGTTYTFTLANARQLVTATSASAKTFTIPPQVSVVWLDNTVIRVVNYGAGALTIAGGAGVTVTNAATTLAQYESAALIRTASNAWTLVPFGGGVPKATVASTTGSPTIDSVSRAGKTIYKFTGTGSITFAAAGVVEVLVCAAGGGGGNGAYSLNAAGGGGAVVRTDNCFVTAAAHTVTVGAGGAQGVNNAGGVGGVSSIVAAGVLAVVAAGGGAGSGGNGTFGFERRMGGCGGGNRTSQGNGTEIAGMGFDSISGGSGAGGGGGAGASNSSGTGGAGITSSITGSSVEYGKGGTMLGTGAGASPANVGRGSDCFNGNGGGVAGGSGVVIVVVG